MFEIVTIETTSLGDRSYLATDGRVAVVVDPQRDIDRVQDLIARLGVRLSHVLETHVHNDYVSGGLALSRATGAEYVLPAHSHVEFGHRSVHDGEVLTAGSMAIGALHTPGHTHHHTSYTLADAQGRVEAVFTGGSLLFGSTGRTDLVGPDDTHELTHAQYHSVRRLARELPADTAVYPSHGFGSFCAATPTSGDSSTVGEQVRVNPALTLGEQAYVDGLLAGLDAYPAYYAHMGPANRAGAGPIDLSMPFPADPAQLRERIAAGEWVVDLRSRTAFAAGHLAGSLGFELSANFITYLGWLYRYGTPLTLIAETGQQVLDARRELVRIGVDEVAGAAVGAIADLAGDGDLRSYPVSDFAGLAESMTAGPVQVLDTRRRSERARGFVRGSLHIPLPDLPDLIDEVPHGEVWIYCGSGYRASIAAALLDRPGRFVVLVDDDYANAARAGLEVREEATAASDATALPLSV